MIEVAGAWEQGWNVPLMEADLWEMAMAEFGVKRLNMAPVSGIKKTWVHEYPTMEDLLEDRAHLTPVFVDERAEVELTEFEHPEDTLYVFGRVSYSPFVKYGEGARTLKIATVKPGMLWGHQALTIILYDRLQP